MKQIIRTTKEVLNSVKINPLDIKLFLVFSFAITLISYFINFESNKDLYESIIPYAGGSPGREYKMIFFFIILYSYIFRNHQKKLLIIRVMSVIYLVFSLYDGISDWTTILPEDYTNPNPYLRYDSLSPLFTIALPLIWIVVITCSQLKDSFNNKKSTNRNIIVNP